jgi:hypothetical protein
VQMKEQRDGRKETHRLRHHQEATALHQVWLMACSHFSASQVLVCSPLYSLSGWKKGGDFICWFPLPFVKVCPQGVCFLPLQDHGLGWKLALEALQCKPWKVISTSHPPICILRLMSGQVSYCKSTGAEGPHRP